jgi:hypothetical protein
MIVTILPRQFDDNTRFQSRHEAADKTSTQTFGAPEAVDDEQIHAIQDRCPDCRLGIDKPPLVKPAAARASSSRLPDVEGFALPQVHYVD